MQQERNNMRQRALFFARSIKQANSICINWTENEKNILKTGY